MKGRAFLGFIVLLAFFYSCDQQDPIERKLEELDFIYELDTQGDWRILMETLDGRSQQVWIYGHPQTAGNIVIREIISPVFFLDQQENPLFARQLLINNYQSEVWGNWGLLQEDEKQLVVYTIKIPDEQIEEYLERALRYCALRADSMEMEFSQGMDHF